MWRVIPATRVKPLRKSAQENGDGKERTGGRHEAEPFVVFSGGTQGDEVGLREKMRARGCVNLRGKQGGAALNA